MRTLGPHDRKQVAKNSEANHSRNSTDPGQIATAVKRDIEAAEALQRKKELDRHVRDLADAMAIAQQYLGPNKAVPEGILTAVMLKLQIEASADDICAELLQIVDLIHNR